MLEKILVTYATCTGSTTGIAEAIGKTLQENGLQVDVRPMIEVTDVTPYRAVVAGSAIQDKCWLPEAMQFILTHQAALARRPVAAFLVCMTLAIQNGKYRTEVMTWLKPVRAMVNPISEGFFTGTLNISQIPTFRHRLMFRASVLSGVWSEGDHRDWNAIHAWANSLPAKLHA